MDKTLVKRVMLVCTCFLLFTCLLAFLMRKQIEMSKPVVAEAETQEKVMYLTFDDGPSKNTKKILKILKKYDVKATFFVTGAFPDYVALLKEEQEQGHGIGVHTYSHDYKEIYSSEEAYFKDVDKVNNIIKEQTGQTSSLLRFPGGTSNTVSRKYSSGIMSTLAKAVNEKGYQYYDWNCENGDGNSHLSADTLVNTALSSVKGKDSAMMLMHDGAGNEATVEALPTILKSLKEQGYQFRIIDGTTPVFHHHIAN